MDENQGLEGVWAKGPFLAQAGGCSFLFSRPCLGQGVSMVTTTGALTRCAHFMGSMGRGSWMQHDVDGRPPSGAMAATRSNQNTRRRRANRVKRVQALNQGVSPVSYTHLRAHET